MAAKTPLRAAWPAWNGFVMEPKFSLSPEASEAATPSAWRVCSASSARRRAAAAAQPRADDRAQRGAALGAHERAHGARGGLGGAGQHDAQRVERGAADLDDRGVRTLAQRGLDDEFGETGGGAHGRHDSGQGRPLQGEGPWPTISPEVTIVPATINRRVLLKSRPVGEPKPT